ncbi:amidohydrolase family protein [Verrucomicrobiota bacterium]
MDFDLLVLNGTVVDGTGTPGLKADVGIKGDQIAAVGELSSAQAECVIDASGCYVCPGFVDAHSHSDAYLLIEPSAASKIYQGITTEVVGNCGASAAPLMGEYRMPSDWLDKEYPAQWSTVAEYRTLFDEITPAVNAAMLVGHNTLHAGVCGYEPRGADSDEMRVMKKRLEQALEEGACGLSSGLLYPPGSAVPAAELVELAKVVGAHGKIYTSHMRSEGKGLLDSLDETIDLCRRAEVRTQISHLKTSGKGNWHLIDAALDKMRSALAEGLPVAADRYPYTAACTDLDVVLPDWAGHGGRERVLRRLRDSVMRKKIREEMQAERHPGYWKTVMIGSTESAYKGWMLLDAAKEMGCEPVDAVLALVDRDNLKTGGIFFGMSEENMWRILREPYVMLGSDASLRAPTGILSDDHPHPRAYGSFTKFLRAALSGQTVRIEEAVRKMTSLPAERFGLEKRGRLEAGYFADVLVFAADEVEEKTSYADPHQLSTGMRHVIVNGTEIIADKKTTGLRSGRFLG